MASAASQNAFADQRPLPGQVAVHMAFVAIFSGSVLSVAYALAFICRSLCVMVDAFCCDIVGSMQLEDIPHVWNVTQAVLRMASECMDGALVAFCCVLVVRALAAGRRVWWRSHAAGPRS